MADAIHATPELGATKMELIVSAVQRELIESAVVAPRVLDVSGFAEPGLKAIEFPRGGSFTPVNRVSGDPGDATVVEFTTDKLELNFNAYLAWIVDYKSKVQARIDSQLELAARAARAHAKYLDQQIIAELELAGIAVHPAGNITYNGFVDMRAAYLGNEGRIEAATLLVGVAQEAALLKIDEFKRADIYGSAVIPSGVIGTIHGVPVVRSHLVGDDNFYLFDREGIAMGMQAGPSYSEQGANEYGSQAVRAVLDQIFGVKALQIGEKTAAATESALIVKHGN